MEAFRKRAASLLLVGGSRRDSLAAATATDRNSSQSPQRDKLGSTEKVGIDGNVDGRGETTRQSAINASDSGQSGFSHGPVRVLPPWVIAVEDEEAEDDPNPSSQLQLAEPLAAHVAQHNHMPAALQTTGFILRHRNGTEPGRRYDARRGAEVPTSRHHPREIASRWRQYAQESGYLKPEDESEHRQLVDENYLNEHEPDFSHDWTTEKNDGAMHTYHSRQRTAWERVQRTVLRSPFIPLIFRLIVFSFCVIALGLGGTLSLSIASVTDLPPDLDLACQTNYDTSKTSALMAVIIDSAAIIYLFYITYDEYKGLPLGLRSGTAKTAVLLFDLLFIVCSSANVTLAFETVARFNTLCDGDIKWKQEFLASTLLVALIAWLMTFAVSVLRVVEKVER